MLQAMPSLDQRIETILNDQNLDPLKMASATIEQHGSFFPFAQNNGLDSSLPSSERNERRRTGERRVTGSKRTLTNNSRLNSPKRIIEEMTETLSPLITQLEEIVEIDYVKKESKEERREPEKKESERKEGDRKDYDRRDKESEKKQIDKKEDRKDSEKQEEKKDTVDKRRDTLRKDLERKEEKKYSDRREERKESEKKEERRDIEKREDRREIEKKEERKNSERKEERKDIERKEDHRDSERKEDRRDSEKKDSERRDTRKRSYESSRDREDSKRSRKEEKENSPKNNSVERKANEKEKHYNSKERSPDKTKQNQNEEKDMKKIKKEGTEKSKETEHKNSNSKNNSFIHNDGESRSFEQFRTTAITLKHMADKTKEKDGMEAALKLYLEAGLKFLESAYVLEQEKKIERAHAMYSQTSEFLNGIARLSAQQQVKNPLLIGLCYKCIGASFAKQFSLRGDKLRLMREEVHTMMESYQTSANGPKEISPNSAFHNSPSGHDNTPTEQESGSPKALTPTMNNSTTSSNGPKIKLGTLKEFENMIRTFEIWMKAQSYGQDIINIPSFLSEIRNSLEPNKN